MHFFPRLKLDLNNTAYVVIALKSVKTVKQIKIIRDKKTIDINWKLIQTTLEHLMRYYT